MTIASANRFVTTNLRLSKERLEELRLKAFGEHKSVAELMRRAIEVYLGYAVDKRKKRGRRAWKSDSMFNIIGIASDPTMTDGSVRHDEVVYGDMMKKKFHPKK